MKTNLMVFVTFLIITSILSNLYGQETAHNNTHVISVSPDNLYVAFSQLDGTIGVYNVATSKTEVLESFSGGKISFIRWNGVGTQFLTTDLDGYVTIWDGT